MNQEDVIKKIEAIEHVLNDIFARGICNGESDLLASLSDDIQEIREYCSDKHITLALERLQELVEMHEVLEIEFNELKRDRAPVFEDLMSLLKAGLENNIQK